jgi:hypothetical protein
MEIPEDVKNLIIQTLSMVASFILGRKSQKPKKKRETRVNSHDLKG